jgi:HlyD family secretion protein
MTAAISESRVSRPRDRGALRWVRRGIIAVAAVLGAGLLVYAWLPKPVAIEVATAGRGTLVVTVNEDGRTRVKDRYVVSTPLTGSVARIELRAGDPVKQGQVLARLVPLDVPLLDARTKREAEARVRATEAGRMQSRAQIERAKAALAFAKKEHVRAKSLVGSGALAPAELDRHELELRAREAELASAEFGSKVADHELAMARTALGTFQRKKTSPSQQVEVPSPVSGRVLKLIQESEGVVQAGSPLLEVGDPAALEIVVDVLTSDAVKIAPRAEVMIERWGGEPLRGRVRNIEPSAFTRLSALGVEEQRVNAVIDLEEPYAKWSALRDGYRVEARIVVARKTDVIQVPTSALFRRGDAWATFRVVEGRARETRVEIGQTNGLEAEVLSGVGAGETLVIHPSDRVVDGASVEVR